MDVMACREVLDNLMEACEILDLDEPDYPKWKELRGKLPTYLLDEEGAVKEWSFKYSGENYDHRHVSHHYDVWPGRAITPEKTPELVQPFILSNRKRGHQDDSAHGVIHRYLPPSGWATCRMPCAFPYADGAWLRYPNLEYSPLSLSCVCEGIC